MLSNLVAAAPRRAVWRRGASETVSGGGVVFPAVHWNVIEDVPTAGKTGEPAPGAAGSVSVVVLAASVRRRAWFLALTRR